MSIGVTEICNLALGHIGSDRIGHIDEDSTEARQCKRFFDASRDAALREYDWDFARRRAVLALLADAVSEWRFVYQLPADCLAPRELAGDCRDDPPIPFRIEETRLLTDRPEAVLIYTGRVVNAGLLDPLFVRAFSLHLAAQIVMPLTQDKQLLQLIEQRYALALPVAKAADANQWKEPAPAPVPDWIAARG